MQPDQHPYSKDSDMDHHAGQRNDKIVSSLLPLICRRRTSGNWTLHATSMALLKQYPPTNRPLTMLDLPPKHNNHPRKSNHRPPIPTPRTHLQAKVSSLPTTHLLILWQTHTDQDNGKNVGLLTLLHPKQSRITSDYYTTTTRSAILGRVFWV
jgi:hypothetical protein